MAETRVVVLLTDATALPMAENIDSKTGPPPSLPKQPFQYGGELNILDDKTVRLLCCQNASKPHVFVAQKLRFDFLADNATSSVTQKAQELAGLVHKLFIERRSGVLLQLTPQRGYHLMFLMDALVRQVNAELQLQNLCLELGQVCYRQIAEDQPMPTALSAGCTNTKFTFNHTNSLLSWLLNEYRMRTAVCTGHEVFDVKYVVFSERENMRFCINLSILFVAMSDLSLGGLCGLRNYFSSDVITAALACTALTACLRAATVNGGEQPVYVLLLCHVVATGNQLDESNVQILGLAHLVCQERKTAVKAPTMPNPANTVESLTNLQHSSAVNILEQLKKFAICQEEIGERFKVVQHSLLQYAQQAQQLRQYRQLFDDNLANFEQLIKHIGHTELGLMLRTSEANLLETQKLFSNIGF